jgi:hypothetical protein
MIVFNKLLVYPFIIILCWLVICIRDTSIAFSIEYRYFNPVTMLGNSLATVQGILTSTYFFYTNDEVVNAWVALLFQRMSFEEIAKEAKQRKSSYIVSSHDSSRRGASSSVVVPYASVDVDKTEEDVELPVISKSKPGNADTLSDTTCTNKEGHDDA